MKYIKRLVLRLAIYLMVVACAWTALIYYETNYRLPPVVSPLWGDKVVVYDSVCWVGETIVLTDSVSTWCVANGAADIMMMSSY